MAGDLNSRKILLTAFTLNRKSMSGGHGSGGAIHTVIAAEVFTSVAEAKASVATRIPDKG
jgi:hypothetical protein